MAPEWDAVEHGCAWAVESADDGGSEAVDAASRNQAKSRSNAKCAAEHGPAAGRRGASAGQAK